LPARLGQGINEMTTQLEQACFEDGEEPAWAGTDDEDVRLDHDRLRGEGSFCAG